MAQTNEGVTPPANGPATSATATAATTSSSPAATAQLPNPGAPQKLREIQSHLQRYRDLSAQGKWAEAGKELDQIQQIVNQPQP